MGPHCHHFLPAFLMLAEVLLAQTPAVDLLYRLPGGTGLPLSPNGTIAFGNVPVGSSGTATLFIVNREQDGTTWVINGVTVPISAFTVGTLSAASIKPGETALVPLTFAPTKSGTTDALLTINLSRGTAGQSQSIYLFLSGSGTSAIFQISYILAQGGNQVSLEQTQLLTFPSTPVGQSVAVVLVVANKGNVVAPVQRVSVSDTAFHLSGLPLLPYQVQPNTDLRFNITFTPTLAADVAATLSLDLGGATRTIRLQGTGTGPQLTVSYVAGGGLVTVAAGETVPFPDTLTGSANTVGIRVANTGNAAARISTLSAAGAGFQIADQPILPSSLAPGATMQFSVVFAPQEPGSVSGRMSIDSTTYELKGIGLGAKLTYSYTMNGVSKTVSPNGVILFPNTGITAKSSALLQVTNQGNLAASLQTVSVSGSSFASVSAPTGSSSVDPGGQLSFEVVFSPQALGLIDGALQIDDRTFVLRGTATLPAAVPSATMTGTFSNASALEQPVVGLTLNEPYELDLTGKLTIAFSSASFADDPSIQFATGGRSVEFRIPAKSLEAVFADSSKTTLSQTGSVAGVITLTASFSVAGVDVTPSPVPSTTINLEMSAPRLRAIQLGSRSGNSIQLLISGYATARAVKQLAFSFAAASGYTLSGQEAALDVEAPFSSWYQSSASTTYGSQFTASVTVTATNISAVRSVSISAANSYGTSSPVNIVLNP